MLYGICTVFVKRVPLYFKLSMCAVICAVMELVYDELLWYLAAEGYVTVNLGVLGACGFYFFVWAANYGVFDFIVDGGRPEYKWARRLAWIMPIIFLPVMIYSQGLSWIAEEVDAGNSFEGVYFRLKRDLTFTKNVPIGSAAHPFCGYLDGGGFSVTVDIRSEGDAGLFACLQGGAIQNPDGQRNGFRQGKYGRDRRICKIRSVRSELHAEKALNAYVSSYNAEKGSDVLMQWAAGEKSRTDELTAPVIKKRTFFWGYTSGTASVFTEGPYLMIGCLSGCVILGLVAAVIFRKKKQHRAAS